MTSCWGMGQTSCWGMGQTAPLDGGSMGAGAPPGLTPQLSVRSTPEIFCTPCHASLTAAAPPARACPREPLGAATRAAAAHLATTRIHDRRLPRPPSLPSHLPSHPRS